MNFFETDSRTALQAKEQAQWIAFGPVVFQSARILRDSGILQFIEEQPDGVTFQAVTESIKLPAYGIQVLMEAGLGIGLLTVKEDLFKTTKTASFLLHDELTRVNMDFTHDVCYQGMFYLEESIRHKKPEGLKVFGAWSTIYEALSKLPAKVQKSWFAFDHFYSDNAFPVVLDMLFKSKPKSILDIGGNTGKWALQCFEHDADVAITIMDLPGQVEMAKSSIEEKGFGSRVHFHPVNILDESQPFPSSIDIVWMSQFLDCFSGEQIVSILKRCKNALAPGGEVCILEPFWDRQRFEVSAFVLQQTSLYFTAMANGNSQMYHSETLIRYIREAGLEVSSRKDNIGVSHTLLMCKPV